MAVNVQDFFFCIHEEISFEIKRRPFLLLSLIVHNKGSFLALQEDLYGIALSTGQWKQNVFIVCFVSWKETREVTSGMQKKKKKMQQKAKTYCHKLSAEKATRCQHSLFFHSPEPV